MPVPRSPPSTPVRRTDVDIDEDINELCRTLDKSRKRHLSVGLLRGDKVQDDLRVQEASASPLLKKLKGPVPSPIQEEQGTNCTGDNMALTMADFEAYMERNIKKRIDKTNDRLDRIDGNMSALQGTVREVESTVRSNSQKIDKHEALIIKNQASIETLRSDMLKIKSGDAFPALPIPTAQDDRFRTSSPQDAEFEEARKAIRMWPVLGLTNAEMLNSVRSFIDNNLELRDKVPDQMILSVGRVAIPSGPGVLHEALVKFTDIQTRDLVMGSAAKLAPFISEGRATAGMRMEVPPRLQQEFRVLFKYGQRLRARHGRGIRRHVKFDDLNRGLFLNVKLQGDEAWTKVSTEVARRGLRARELLTDEEIERRLDITGPLSDPAPRPRSASLNEQPMATDVWTQRRSGSVSTS